MKAKLEIVSVELPAARIKPSGGKGQGTIGHAFDLRPTVKAVVLWVKAIPARTGPVMGAHRIAPQPGGVGASGDIEVPALEWNETIEWFAPAPLMGGHRATAKPVMGAHRAPPQLNWRYVGKNQKNMYADNPNSNTFKAWHSYKFFWATVSPPNSPPPGLAATAKAADADAAARQWIAQNGFQWVIPELTDRPAMGLAGGSGGGGGASLVTTNTRRRVIYFDLGFTGCSQRVKFVQILESIGGEATIHKFIASDVPKSQVDDPANLARWRSQVSNPLNTSF